MQPAVLHDTVLGPVNDCPCPAGTRRRWRRELPPAAAGKALVTAFAPHAVQLAVLLSQPQLVARARARHDQPIRMALASRAQPGDHVTDRTRDSPAAAELENLAPQCARE
ncbi:Low-affinity potassium transport protein [Frankliniella fusca]|uniref:Low-affinity potassium transport protein n=1 Tax=Frankliniella fusca TaxID=407009 RepID=A0AAE1HYU5_9NEOP|nr:Low-affinity potassium transport protein [Frankliniella fusca]